jgi:hypothetical protein
MKRVFLRSRKGSRLFVSLSTVGDGRRRRAAATVGRRRLDERELTGVQELPHPAMVGRQATESLAQAILCAGKRSPRGEAWSSWSRRSCASAAAGLKDVRCRRRPKRLRGAQQQPSEDACVWLAPDGGGVTSGMRYTWSRDGSCTPMAESKALQAGCISPGRRLPSRGRLCGELATAGR